jgi:hypothetical protein
MVAAEKPDATAAIMGQATALEDYVDAQLSNERALNVLDESLVEARTVATSKLEPATAAARMVFITTPRITASCLLRGYVGASPDAKGYVGGGDSIHSAGRDRSVAGPGVCVLVE